MGYTIPGADYTVSPQLQNNVGKDLGTQLGRMFASVGPAFAAQQSVTKKLNGIRSDYETTTMVANQNLIQAKVSEQQRLQDVAISEGQRTQLADAKGKLFEFEAQEDRDNSDISYNISKETGAAQREAAYRSQRDSATSGIFTGIGSIAGGIATAGITGGMDLVGGKLTKV